MSRMKKILGTVALTAAASLALIGCTDAAGAKEGGDGGQKGMVAMSFAGLNLQIWNDQIPFIKKSVEAAGYKLITDNPEWNAQTQVTDWDSWIVQGEVKAIMGYPVQSDSLVAVTQQANAAKVPVLGYLSEWKGITAAVVTDHVADGKLLGKRAAKWIRETYGDKKVDVALLGYPDTDLGRLRGQGIQEGLKESGLSPNINQHSVVSLNDGYAAVQNQLNAFPDTKVWLAISNDPALGAYQALTDAGIAPTDHSVFLGNLDGTDAELKNVMDDTFWRVIYMVPAKEFGEANAKMLISAAEGKEVEDFTLTHTEVTAANAESYLLKNQ